MPPHEMQPRRKVCPHSLSQLLRPEVPAKSTGGKRVGTRAQAHSSGQGTTELGPRAVERRGADRRDRRRRDRLHRRRGADLGAARRRGRARPRAAIAHARAGQSRRAGAARGRKRRRYRSRYAQYPPSFDADWVAASTVGQRLQSSVRSRLRLRGRRRRTADPLPMATASTELVNPSATTQSAARPAARPRRRCQQRLAGQSCADAVGTRRDSARWCRPSSAARASSPPSRSPLRRSVAADARRQRAGRDVASSSSTTTCSPTSRAQLQLAQPAHGRAPSRSPPGDYVFELTDRRRQPIATLRLDAEAARRRDRQQRHALHRASRSPASRCSPRFVLRYMRRTAATIAAGETRLRHLALHDPLCGLPNRIFFGERLEAVIADVRDGGAAGGRVLHRPRPLQGRQRHARPSDRRRADPQRDAAALAHRARRRSGGAARRRRIRRHHRASAPTTRRCMTHRQPHHRGAVRALLDQQPHHRDRRQHRHRRDRPAAAAAPPTSCAMPTWRSTAPRTKAATAPASTTRRWTPTCRNRKLLENDLRAAIENDELRARSTSRSSTPAARPMVGVEALCRWTHPQRGEIPPAEFIPIAEHSGLIIELGEWVLRRACLDGKAWPGITVAVNVSPLQFRRADFVDVVERILAETGFDPTRLELEAHREHAARQRRDRRSSRCAGSRRSACGSRSTISAPAIRACSICAASRSTSSRSTAASCARSRRRPTPPRSCTRSSASAAASA